MKYDAEASCLGWPGLASTTPLIFDSDSVDAQLGVHGQTPVLLFFGQRTRDLDSVLPYFINNINY